MCFWKCKMCWNLTSFAEIEVVHLYQPFGAKLEVFLAISQGGQCCQHGGYRVAVGGGLLPM